MKQKLYSLLALAISVLVFNTTVNAQHCAQPSGAGVCSPNNSLTVVGFYPSDTALPCAVVGVPYDTVIQFHTPATAQGYTLNWIRINEIYNLPCGLCWRSSTSNNQINGNSTGCVRVTGTTYDAPGEYMIKPYADVNVQFGLFPLTLSNVNIDSVMGLKYYARVQLPGGTCVPVDTLDPGLTAHTAGSITAVSLAGNTSVCTGGSSTFSISNAGSYYAYKWSTGAFTSSINVSTAGTYSVTAYANCTSATASRTLTINTNPTPTVTPSGSTTFCAGGSVTLDAGSGYSAYAWSNGGNTQTITPSQSGTYTVTVTQNGCTGSSNTITVTVNNNPTASITPSGATTFCAGGSVTLDAGAGYSSYTWNSGETTQTISATQTGSYVVTVTQNGCTGVATAVPVTVNSNPAPTVNASGPTTFCAGGSVTLDAGAGYSSYLWSNSATTQTINATQSDTYTVTVTQSGCSGTSNTVTVTVNANPVVSVTAWSPTALCPGGDVWLQATTGYTSYVWSDSETGDHILANAAGVYNVTATQNGCSGTSNSVTVTMTNPNATITANGPTTFCTGGSVTLDAGAGFASYLWSDNSTNQTLVVNASGNYTVTTTLNGCTGTSNTITVTVTSNTLNPVITASPSFNICPGGSATLDVGIGYDTYAWSSGPTTNSILESNAGTYDVTVTQGTCSGTASATLNVGNFPVTVNVTPAGPVNACAGDIVLLDAGGGYDTYAWSNSDNTAMTNVTTSGSYIVTVTSNGCTGMDTVDVNITTVVAAISPASPVSACTGDVVTLDASAGFDTYSWSSGDVTQTTQPVSSGSYSVTVTQNNCSASDTVDVTFFAHPVVSIAASGPLSFCEGDSVTLDAGAGYSTYAWSGGEQTQTLDATASGTYSVTVTQNGCDGSASVAVSVTGALHPAITPAGPVNACVGDNITLDAGAGYASYSWSNGDLIQSIQPTTSGTYSVVVSQNGCTATDSVVVTFNAIPHATITPSGTQTVCTPQTVTFDAGAGYSAYQWSNNATSRTITVGASGTYDVTVTQNGCSGAATSTVALVANTTPAASFTVTNLPFYGNLLTVTPANAASYTWIATSDTVNGPFSFIETTASNIDTGYCPGVRGWGNDNGNRDFISYEYITVVVQSGAGCADTASWNKLQYNCGGGIADVRAYHFSLQPNPANDVLYVSYELNQTSNVNIAVLDLTGRKMMSVLSEKQGTGEYRLPVYLNQLSSGIYLLNFATEAGTINRKFIKE